MWTVVLFAACLLAASANPLANFNEHSTADAQDTDSKHASSADDSEMSAVDHTTSDTEEQHPPIDESPGYTGDVPSTNSENPDSENPSSGDSDGGDSETGDGLTSLVSTVSTTTTAGASEVDTIITESTNITEPPDGDPYDCKTKKPETHIYKECQFMCGGDMMEMALENATCLLNHTDLDEDNNSRGPNKNITGVCRNGQCVANSTEVTAPTSESSPAATITPTNVKEFTSETSEPEDSARGNSSQSTTTELTSTTGSTSTESPTSPEHVAVEKDSSSQPPWSTSNNNSPVALP